MVALILATMYSYGKADGVRHIPNVLKLHTEQITSAYPNPFTDNTTIFYMADQDAFVRVKLFNNLGGFMGQIFDDLVEKGATYQFELDGSKMAPGVYFYTIETDKNVLHRRIELVR
ncbi:MAG: T9SS type A sorting domain-containing protein [Bacteroidetes bacterium]|jgi:hypothetical protein|nr:T9SS type A sorting domain-containing protein [Bacteroidota bacterium]MBK9399431.1 T9SS type A sorting domain-containing protein [Bacteroidota bacterium]MBL0097287.1 T9SS type A sorting domain-containing protein [Bacteroidota bacterium]